MPREKADQTLEDGGRAIDETADAVISRARSRADEVLASARAKTDRASQPGTPTPRILKSERVREDQALQEERDTADEALREERAQHLALLSRERQDTDKDLSHERELSDDALSTRDEFLGIVSHDLRTLLNAILESAALIEKGTVQTDQVEQVVTHARRIQRAGARMNRLIGDLVDVASIEAGVLAVTREVGDPTTVVTEAVDTFQVQAATAGLSLTAEIVPPLPLAAFDAARILQVLTNLLSNAIKFTPAHGRIVVHAERFGDEIRFAVTDTGVGIANDNLDAVFVRFLQVVPNDRRGVGLGLYISKAIVQGHGGRIWAESQIGRGSTFCFTLPIHVAPSQVRELSRTGPRGPCGPAMAPADILAVVEDQFYDLRKQLEAQLTRTAEIQRQLEEQRQDIAELRRTVDLAHRLRKELVAKIP